MSAIQSSMQDITSSPYESAVPVGAADSMAHATDSTQRTPLLSEFRIPETRIEQRTMTPLREELALSRCRLAYKLDVDLAAVQKSILVAADEAAVRRGRRVVWIAHDCRLEMEFFRAIGQEAEKFNGFRAWVDTQKVTEYEFKERLGELLETYHLANDRIDHFTDLKFDTAISHDALMDAIYTAKAFLCQLIDESVPAGVGTTNGPWLLDPNIIFIAIDVEAYGFADSERPIIGIPKPTFTQVGLCVFTSEELLHTRNPKDWPQLLERRLHNYNIRLARNFEYRPVGCHIPEEALFPSQFPWFPNEAEKADTYRDIRHRLTEIVNSYVDVPPVMPSTLSHLLPADNASPFCSNTTLTVADDITAQRIFARKIEEVTVKVTGTWAAEEDSPAWPQEQEEW